MVRLFQHPVDSLLEDGPIIRASLGIRQCVLESRGYADGTFVGIEVLESSVRLDHVRGW